MASDVTYQKYYTAVGAYAYPSSNANDGGEDNTEYNLKTITKKLTVKSFIVMKEEDPEKNTYFVLSADVSNLKISGGECCIGGYFFSLGDTSVPLATPLLESTKYHILLRILYDGSGHLRGDGENVQGVLECRGITVALATEAQLKLLDPSEYLDLAEFTSDSKGNLPKTINTYIYNTFRFCFLNMKMIKTNNNMTIEEWIQYGLDHLSQLSYYESPSDKEPSSTLSLEKGNIIYSGDKYHKSFNITAIEDRTHVVEKDKTTEITAVRRLGEGATDNGSSDYLCRSDHFHDERYLLKTSRQIGSGVYQESNIGLKTPFYTTSVGDTTLRVGESTDSSSSSPIFKIQSASNTVSADSTYLRISGRGGSALSLFSSAINIGSSTAIPNAPHFSASQSDLTLSLGDKTSRQTAQDYKIQETPQIYVDMTSRTLTYVNNTTSCELSTEHLQMNSSASESSEMTPTRIVVSDGPGTSSEIRANEISTTGTITAAKVFNAVWNDYAELYLKDDSESPSISGYVVCKVPGKSTYELCNKKNHKLAVGVISRNYGHLVGGKKGRTEEENLKDHYPVALAGRVTVSIKRGVHVKEGDLLCADDRGCATVKRFFTRGRVIGKALESGQKRVLMQVFLG